MAVLLEAATLGSFDLVGGANGVHVTKFEWHKVPRTNRRPRPRRHGTVDLTRYYEARLFEMAGVIYGLEDDVTQDRLDAFEAALALDGETATFEWRLAGRDELEAEQAEVRIEGDLEYTFDVDEPTVIRWALTLFAEDPRRYGVVQRSGSYDPTEGANDAGVLFDVDFPLEFSSGDASALSVTNEGTYPTPPVFTVTGPVTNPSVENVSTGESIETAAFALLSGSVAVFDVDARTLTVDGTLRPDLIKAADTTWFELGAGQTTLRLGGDDMVADETSLAVTFYDARI